MPFWNFSKIVPPAPNDPLVNEQTQLNNNWDYADGQLTLLTTNPMSAVLPGAETGQEWIYNGRLGVWSGTQLVFPEDIELSWTAWSPFTLLSPAAPRATFTPQWRSNPLIRQVELAGGVLFNAAAAAWPLSLVAISDEAAPGGIPVAFAPMGGITYMSAATSIPSTANRGASAHIAVDNNAGVNCRIRVRFMGASGGGNFVALDKVRWYY